MGHNPHITLASGTCASLGGTLPLHSGDPGLLSLLPTPSLCQHGPMAGQDSFVAGQDGSASRWNGGTGTFSILRGETTLHQLV